VIGENMSQLKTKYSKEEMAKLGDEIYEKKIRSEVENKYQNKVVAIDIETENYAIGNNVIEASKELAKLCKTNDVWFVRVGHPTLYRIASFDMRREK
jgi:23S rRNA maturation mini-RNase III